MPINAIFFYVHVIVSLEIFYTSCSALARALFNTSNNSRAFMCNSFSTTNESRHTNSLISQVHQE